VSGRILITRLARVTLQGMARVRSEQAAAWPLVPDRSVRRGSRVKRDFACTFTRNSSPVVGVLRSQSCLMLEGRARTLSGPSPDLSQPVLFASAVIYGQVVIVLAGLITDVGPASRLARVADQRAVCVAMASCCEHVTGACAAGRSV